MRTRLGQRLALLALAAVGTLGCDGFIATVEPTPTLISRRESIRQRPMVAVVRGLLVEAIRASARVEAARRTDLFFKMEGRIASLRVRDGDEVAAGDVLAELETGRLDADVATALEAASSAQLRLDAARQRAANERAAAHQAVANAELAVEVRNTELARLLARATDDQIEALDVNPADYEVAKVVDVDAAESEAAVFRARQVVVDATLAVTDLQATGALTPAEATAQAQAELTARRTDLAAARQHAIATRREADRLGVRGSAIGTPVAMSELQVVTGSRADAAEAEVAGLEAQIARFVGGRTDADAVEARAATILTAGASALTATETALDVALAELRAKEARLQDFTNPPSTARLRVALNNLLAAEFGAENTRDQIERLRRGESAADFELQILENDLSRATIALETLQREQSEHIIMAPFAGVITFTNASPGKTARAFEEIVGLADPAELVVEVQISNEDQAKLAVGQVADITLDAFPGVTFSATVDTIPHSIVSQTGRTVRIPFATLSVDWGGTAVRLGMIARVSITLQTKADVLKIPITAVKSLNERTFIETVLNEQRRSLPVVTGIKSDTEIEVVVGLEEGQTIFASP